MTSRPKTLQLTLLEYILHDLLKLKYSDFVLCWTCGVRPGWTLPSWSEWRSSVGTSLGGGLADGLMSGQREKILSWQGLLAALEFIELDLNRQHRHGQSGGNLGWWFYSFFYGDVFTQTQQVPLLSLPPVAKEGIERDFDLWCSGPPGCAGSCSGSPARVSGLRYAAMELAVWVFVAKLTALSLRLSLEDVFGYCPSKNQLRNQKHFKSFEFVWSHSDQNRNGWSVSWYILIFTAYKRTNILKNMEHHLPFWSSRCGDFGSWLACLPGAVASLVGHSGSAPNSFMISRQLKPSQTNSWQLNRKCLDWLVTSACDRSLEPETHLSPPRKVKVKQLETAGRCWKILGHWEHWW